MRYLGSKSVIRDNILDVIHQAADVLNIDNYYEPFVGGCNIIPYVNIDNKYGSDYSEHLIDFLNYIRENGVESLPDFISEEDHYKVRHKQIEIPGYLYFYYMNFGSFSGCWRGYGVMENDLNRLLSSKNNLREELEYLKDFNIERKSYDEVQIKPNSVIYCDPPYKKVTGYKDTRYRFDHNKFEKWAIEKSKNNFVIVSEYFMRKPFINIEWIEMKKGILGNDKATEGIFLIEGGYGVKQYLKSVEDIDIEL